MDITLIYVLSAPVINRYIRFANVNVRWRYLRILSKYNHHHMLCDPIKEKRTIKTPALIVLNFGILEIYRSAQVQE
jgi:hypothetical protein